ncbi:stage II sporulation protein R [Pelotomaculum terephthalicicum JT]|uniref:stage II sporulation protein R n=1 Tax=Pelotomaculum TaxID=191373 RepID=UPI0009C466B5|nr:MULTISPECIES: stage II sporulation protein R [Pelotomaculum]MCG9968305.1 stage II sporulation protein R [Pelotomaculum terephthalicicum JT]OPX89491.1 MAG: Stage II sporulation protein R (spore_II_R) [Pelotomaculum sp. PtaB.Bin117]OPY63248.1 MAG: Stage II sporulation protein R (spore_II_R) [Pelotomaculum sp. PtaU1.Bin065]
MNLSRKQKLIPLGLIILTATLSVAAWHNKTSDTTYPPDRLIRLHVVANSDCAADQELKRKVRDEIIRSVSPEFLKAQNILAAREIAAANLGNIKEIASREINAAGKDYSVEVRLENFTFPTKHYGPFVLPAGDYESVRVVIGSGGGANWWCVLFPPLCFVDMPRETAVDLPENFNSASSIPAPAGNAAAERTPAGTAVEKIATAEENVNDAASIDNHVQVEFRFRILDLLNKFFTS